MQAARPLYLDVFSADGNLLAVLLPWQRKRRLNRPRPQLHNHMSKRAHELSLRGSTVHGQRSVAHGLVKRHTYIAGADPWASDRPVAWPHHPF